MHSGPILTINSGSSSLKLGLFVRRDGDERPLFEGLVDDIGKVNAKLSVKDGSGRVVHSASLDCITPRQGLGIFTSWLAGTAGDHPPAIGHRVVHGGPRLTAHQRITPRLVEQLQQSVHFAPLHIPQAIALIEEAQKIYPGVEQFACFDTAFHQTLPTSAAMFPLPRDLLEQGVRRYGFHGLSYESILQTMGEKPPRRLVIAHLGNGASLAAVKDGLSIDTTMGLTPTGGIPMGTRSGDLDPGVILFLLRNRCLDADTLERLLNRESGLLGISGTTADMRDLQRLSKEGNSSAKMAIEIFALAIKKEIGSFAALLGGIDSLIFTGGIGEHSAALRGNVCSGLDFLGIELDEGQNQQNSQTISAPSSGCQVRVMESQEDRQIARHCRTLISTPPTAKQQP